MENQDGIEIEVHGQTLRCYRNGDVFRLLPNGVYKFVKKHKNHADGYYLLE